jgi:predicted outer membrane protein
MSTKITTCVAIALTAAVAAGCNRDTNEQRTSAIGTAGRADALLAEADRDLLSKVAIRDLAEIELGKMAVSKAKHADVKKFGQSMVDEHTRSSTKLEQLAGNFGLTLPRGLDEDHVELRDKLAREGADFDREYVDAMIDEHEALLDDLGSRVDKEKLNEWRTRMSSRTSGEKIDNQIETTLIVAEPSDDKIKMQINQWAAETYPLVYAHLEAAKQLKESVQKARTN